MTNCINYARFNGLEYNLTEAAESDGGERCEAWAAPQSSNQRWNPRAELENNRALPEEQRHYYSPILTVEPRRDEVFLSIKMAKENKGYVKGFKIRLRLRRGFS